MSALLDGLRDGVQRAIEHLGQGFLAHSANTALREKLRSGALDKQDYYRQILRLVYRLLFLFVAEDRDLLLSPTADPAAQKRYRELLRHDASASPGHHACRLAAPRPLLWLQTGDGETFRRWLPGTGSARSGQLSVLCRARCQT